MSELNELDNSYNEYKETEIDVEKINEELEKYELRTPRILTIQ